MNKNFNLRATVIIILLSTQIFAGETEKSQKNALHSGAIETGLAGSLTVSQGVSNATVFLRGMFFRDIDRKNLLGFGLESAYTHIRSLNQIDVQATIAWQRKTIRAMHFFALIGGGLRQEFLGSFRQSRFPLGFNLGVRNMLSSSAALRFEYSFRRFFSDPIANFSEHRLIAGISIFFRNQRHHRK